MPLGGSQVPKAASSSVRVSTMSLHVLLLKARAIPLRGVAPASGRTALEQRSISPPACGISLIMAYARSEVQMELESACIHFLAALVREAWSSETRRN